MVECALDGQDVEVKWKGILLGCTFESSRTINHRLLWLVSRLMASMSSLRNRNAVISDQTFRMLFLRSILFEMTCCYFFQHFKQLFLQMQGKCQLLDFQEANRSLVQTVRTLCATVGWNTKCHRELH